MNRIDILNNGLGATTNLNECLQIDQEHLFRVVLTQKKPPLSLQELLIQIQSYAKDIHFRVCKWVWMAVREKLSSDLIVSIQLLSTWVINPNPYVRWFAIPVECLRPRGGWSKHISELKTQPEMALSLLEPLKNEPEKYVQDSVANWLNDASKTRPSWVSDLYSQWLSESDSAFTQRIVKKAIRTINKPLKENNHEIK
ncbi:3-methyladenine DNA glycosylase AlkC [Gilliamella bombicola]|uniref:3-methyladenine DNA glycosylase AlkC n=1 Tax=Gilliamella bombicola TaxID=1798182 RepID=A0A1C3ZAZ0_9GAMM|nr:MULTISPECIES: DNA alkylation repair protein [Gilliamella]NUF27679.1 hypothetical protein [Gilliamella sp. ESL0254]SCB79515.1 3-methyladenine DNA glycosylase AlkC [Gilliamella bombicola]